MSLNDAQFGAVTGIFESRFMVMFADKCYKDGNILTARGVQVGV